MAWRMSRMVGLCLVLLGSLALAEDNTSPTKRHNPHAVPASQLSSSDTTTTTTKNASVSFNLPMIALSDLTLELELPLCDRLSFTIPLRGIYPDLIKGSVRYRELGTGWLVGGGVGAKFYISQDDVALDGGAYIGTHIAVLVGQDSAQVLTVAAEARSQFGYSYVFGPGIVVDPYVGLNFITFFTGQTTRVLGLDGINPLIGLNLGFAF